MTAFVKLAGLSGIPQTWQCRKVSAVSRTRMEFAS